MSRKFTLLALMASILIWLANSGTPPNQVTGAPGEGLCTNCHSLNGGTQDGSVTLTGIPATIMPNTAYVLTLTNSNPNGIASEAGFEVTILNASNNMAGSMSNPGMFSALANQGGRQYWKHSPSQLYPGSNMVEWTVTWTSPAGPAGETITAYCAGNVANGNNLTSGDLIVTSQATGQMGAGAPPVVVVINMWEDVSCFGGSDGSATASPSMGTPPYTYLWSNGGNTQTINNIAVGTYTVTVSDVAGGSGTASIVISQPPNLVLQTPVITQVSCNGGADGSITASSTGGSAPYSYAWSNGGNGATISNLAAGSYTVTVTDNNDCTKSASYNVTQPAALVINLENLDPESCAGQNDGSITISTQGGTTPVFAEWSNGAIGNTISDLEPDAYSVTVTDNNDCTATAIYVVQSGGVIEVDLINITHVSCGGGNDGSITVAASGGASPYTYMWSNGDSGAMITDLAAGNYLLTVTDNNGCETVSLYVVNQPTPFAVTIMQTGANLCNGDANVALTAEASGGAAPYTGVWSNGSAGLTITGLAAGTYTVTITDNSGCTSTASTTITDPPVLTTTVMVTHETSAGANDGTATANAGGGTPGYNYLWSNGGSTQTITDLAPGPYTVTVTDANGCTKVATGQVNAFGCQLEVNLGPDIEFCAGETIALTAMTTGATGLVTYLWSNGSSSETVTINTPGEICVTVTDESGCQDEDCIILTEIILPAPVCVVTNESAPDANDGAITCDTIPGIITYLWSNGATTTSITGLAPGEYCLTITDVNGCTADACFIVQEAGCALLVTSIITDVNCNGTATGAISVSVENATPPVSFLWSDGSTDAGIDTLSAGDYSVTITDAAGCFTELTYTVAEPEPIVIVVDSIELLSDVAGVGFIMISVNGGTPPYTYLWTTPSGSTNTDEDQLSPEEVGYYSVSVGDANGCVVTLDSIFLDSDVAVGKIPDLQPVVVYPVPVQDRLYFTLPKDVKEAIVTGVDGRTWIHNSNMIEQSIDVAILEAGWYVVRIFDGENWYIARMVK